MTIIKKLGRFPSLKFFISHEIIFIVLDSCTVDKASLKLNTRYHRCDGFWGEFSSNEDTDSYLLGWTAKSDLEPAMNYMEKDPWTYR